MDGQSMRDRLYPYLKDEHEHEHAYVAFNIPGVNLSFDAANIVAEHLFDKLKCGPPGTMGEPEIHYDALGTTGGPWQQGEWKPISQPRAQVVVTAADKPVSDMTDEELAELEAAIEAVKTAKRSGAIDNSDETGEVI